MKSEFWILSESFRCRVHFLGAWKSTTSFFIWMQCALFNLNFSFCILFTAYSGSLMLPSGLNSMRKIA